MQFRRRDAGGPAGQPALLGLLLLASFLLASCRGGGAKDIAGAPIIIISIDTLRSDRLPAYGYSRVDTPRIDEFRRDAILFERAYAQCPLTLVSHASMFTGVMPSEHGVRDNIGFALGPKPATLAEIVKAKGYATGGAISAIVLRGETGIKRGFDFWDDDVDVDPTSLSMGRAQRGGDETRLAAQKWIDERGHEPFLFFLHLYEPHTPYEPWPEFRARYGATYDAEVATADAIVGRFLDYLRGRGIYDKATILLTSDHGEGLGDHAEDEHGVFLYREAIQVPMMLKLPKGSEGGKSVTTPVQLIDVFPTFAKAFNAATAAAGGDAVTLTDIAAGAKPDRIIYSETFYPRFHFGWNELHSAISKDDHFILAPKPELYNLASDPAERTNTLQDNRRAYNALRNRITPYVKAAEAPQAIDSETARQLAALGYIGSAASTSPAEQLPDAKDRIGDVARIKQGLLAFQGQRYADSVTVFSELLRDNPRMLDVWNMQARALSKLGRREEAIEAAKSGLRVAPSATNLAILVGNLSLDLERYDEAAQHARIAVHDVPSQAHFLLAQIALAQKDFSTASRETGLATEKSGDKPFAQMLRGQIAIEQGRHEEALSHYDAALAEIARKKHSPVPRLHFSRGDALARLGRGEEAGEAFRAEIRLFPDEPQPYKNLILLYVVEGKNDLATQLIFDLEKASPTPPSYLAIAEALKTVGDRRGARYWTARGLKQFPADRGLTTFARTL